MFVLNTQKILVLDQDQNHQDHLPIQTHHHKHQENLNQREDHIIDVDQLKNRILERDLIQEEDHIQEEDQTLEEDQIQEEDRILEEEQIEEILNVTDAIKWVI